jgi:L,D-peptidoglycan transpeptidase YkuD (ErfK/YbiS/YcfS/YnhG family)
MERFKFWLQAQKSHLKRYFPAKYSITEQKMVVTHIGGYRGRLACFEKVNLTWEPVGISFPVVLGRLGLTRVKIDDDCKTPCGEFPILQLFARTPQKSKFATRTIFPDSKWILDSKHKDYNSHVAGASTAKTFINLDQDIYDPMLVLSLNLHPAKPGEGSGFFFHVWDGSNMPTAGSIACSREHMRLILNWIQPGLPFIQVRANPDEEFVERQSLLDEHNPPAAFGLWGAQLPEPVR